MTFLDSVSVMLVLLIAIVLPLVLGHLVAKWLRLKDEGSRIGVCLLALFLGVAPFVWQYVRYYNARATFESRHTAWEEGREEWLDWQKKSNDEKREALEEGEKAPEEVTALSEPIEPPDRPLLWKSDVSDPPPVWQDAIKLGIDLAGGTNLVYEVAPGAIEKAVEENPDQTAGMIMERMVGAIARRVNPSGTEEVTVRQVGDDRVEIIMPGADAETVETMKRRITRLGSLEFAILACRSWGQFQHPDIIRRAEALSDNERDVKIDGQLVGSWLDVARNPRTGTQKSVSDHGDAVTRTVNVAGEDVEQFLVIFEEQEDRVTGKYLDLARAERDTSSGERVVSFTFDSVGGTLFGNLTSKYRPRDGRDPFRLAVLLDNKVQSAPNLQAVIRRNGQISGVQGDEVEELVNVLNAGALAVPLSPPDSPAPITEATVGPSLAGDVRQKGLLAIGIASAVVVLFMLIYYRFAGLVADVCLLMNIVLVMGVMVLINATFTLPGLAGIVLTIGMAVDANVLIFERIREEKAKGSRLRMAIQNGFGKAFTTIVDANVTTLLTAVVLYAIGTDQVRGFAVTLFIGIVTSMFTALYVGRTIFDVAERKRWITDLNMMSIVRDTHWDFLGKRMLAFGISAALIVGGMFALASRGEDNLDIDFSGGIMVTFSFKEEQQLEDVQAALDDQFTEGKITLEKLLTGDETGTGAKKFRMRVKDSDVVRPEGQEDMAIEEVIQRQVSAALQKAKLPLWVVELDKPADGWEAEIVSIPAAPAGAGAEGDDEGAEDKFAGGHEVDLLFTETVERNRTATNPITLARIEGEVVARLQDVAGARYERADELIALSFPGGKESGKTVELKVAPDVDEADLVAVLDTLERELPRSPIFDEVNSFSSSVGDEMKWSAAQAMFVSLIAIIAYIWFRFEQVTFGLAAVVALVHDVLVVLGLVAVASYLAGNPFGNALQLYDFRINLPMIAAFLTIVGYSLNDTIVVFDRIREVRGKNPALTQEMVNTSLNQTLARTLLTSLTTFIVVAILYWFGGEGIHGFAFCLVLGVIVGTYSSIYVASPVLVWLMNRPGSATAAATSSLERKATAAG